MLDFVVRDEEVDLLALMAALSSDMPALPVASAVLALARFLSRHQDSLTDEQGATLLALGAGLWQRSIDLEDTVAEIDAMLARNQ